MGYRTRADSAHPPTGSVLTSLARTAWCRRLPRAAQSLWDLLEMKARGRGLSVPGGTLRHGPSQILSPASPVLGAQGRGHNGPPALRSASPVWVPCTPAEPRPREPNSARPPSAHGIPPKQAPLRAKGQFRIVQSGTTCDGASPALRVEDSIKSGDGGVGFCCRFRVSRRATPNPLHIPMASGTPSRARQGG